LDGREYTLEEIGKEYGVTRERIRQIEQKALQKLIKSVEGQSELYRTQLKSLLVDE